MRPNCRAMRPDREQQRKHRRHQQQRARGARLHGLGRVDGAEQHRDVQQPWRRPVPVGISCGLRVPASEFSVVVCKGSLTGYRRKTTCQGSFTDKVTFTANRRKSLFQRCRASSVARLVALHLREEFLRLRGFAGALFRARPRRTSPRKCGSRCRIASPAPRPRDDRASRWWCTCARSGVSYLNESGVPHFSQKPRCARLELAKKLRRAPGPGEVRGLAARQRREHAAAGALAHAAVAHVRVFERRVEGITDGAALAAAGGHRRARLASELTGKCCTRRRSPSSSPCGTTAGAARRSRA